jgi:hypothetical protein
MTVPMFIVGYLCGLVLISIFVWISVALHMAYTKMLECLKNSSSILALASLRHGGPWGRLLLIGGISGLVTFPNFYSKRGGINMDDINKLPVSLKRKLVTLQWCVIVLLALLALFVSLYKILAAFKL